MTNPMPLFNVFKHGSFIGTVSAVSIDQACIRARKLYGRCEVIHNVDGAPVGGRPARIVDCSYTHGRSPYPVGDFEARRKAEIARYHASR